MLIGVSLKQHSKPAALMLTRDRAQWIATGCPPPQTHKECPPDADGHALMLSGTRSSSLLWNRHFNTPSSLPVDASSSNSGSSGRTFVSVKQSTSSKP